MWRVRQQEMDLNGGASATAVLLADQSGSIPFDTKHDMDHTIPDFKREIRGLRVYGFHAGIKEAPYRDIRNGHVLDGLMACWPDDGITDADWRREARTGRMIRKNTTYLGACLEAVASLNPRLTIIISDGGAADKRLALRVADRMAGEIDCYFVHAKEDAKHLEDWRFLEQLARRGRGRFVTIRGLGDFRSEMARSLAPFRPSHPHYGDPQPMRRPIQGGRFDIGAPPEQHHVVVEKINVWKKREYHIRDAPDEVIDHTQPQDIALQFEPTQVVVDQSAPPIVQRHEPPSLLNTIVSAMLGGPAPRKQPDATYRGSLQAAPQPALPAPQRQEAPAAPAGRALPAPPAGRALPAPPPAGRALPAPSRQIDAQPQAQRSTWTEALFARKR